MITLALGGVFGLIGWILALVALNYRFEVLGIVAQPSIWTQAVDYNGMSASFLAAASFVFIISITAWLPGFLSFAGAAMAHKEPSRARPFGAALGCIYMLYMLLAVLYFVYHVDRHLDGIGPSITNRERHANQTHTRPSVILFSSQWF